MKKKIITTPNAPQPIGPYNQAVMVDDTLYISGQIALDPSSGQLMTESIEQQTTLVMNNLNAILHAADMDFSHVVKTSIFLMDMNDFAKVNEIYANYFERDFPARETIQVAGLPRGVAVEISMIACK
ncbi:MAG: RidA family protein [Bacteroidota bacterium]|jgi:2-iminobutanoate/2-iminopropanoate deaminase|nr:RidA family protein [Bacteroidota bacterium]